MVKAHRAGIKFFQSKIGVLLTEGRNGVLSSDFIRCVQIVESGEIIKGENGPPTPQLVLDALLLLRSQGSPTSAPPGAKGAASSSVQKQYMALCVLRCTSYDDADSLYSVHLSPHACRTTTDNQARSHRLQRHVTGQAMHAYVNSRMTRVPKKLRRIRNSSSTRVYKSPRRRQHRL